MFDYDGDGKITPSDIENFIRVINYDEMLSDDKKTADDILKQHEDSNNLEHIKQQLIDEIFGELVTFKKKPYISFEVFKELMLETNIDKTCTIYFNEDI